MGSASLVARYWQFLWWSSYGYPFVDLKLAQSPKKSLNVFMAIYFVDGTHPWQQFPTPVRPFLLTCERDQRGGIWWNPLQLRVKRGELEVVLPTLPSDTDGPERDGLTEMEGGGGVALVCRLPGLPAISLICFLNLIFGDWAISLYS